jgi:LAO/AO transport system kinase
MPRTMRTRETPEVLVERMRRGERGALARLLSLAESEPEKYGRVADSVSAAAGRALRVGITGPGGAGKSTLINVLAGRLRADSGAGGQPPRVAVLATDPSSERTGGALLGDRIRFGPECADDGLFFRSVATRGAAGGFAHAGFDQLDLLDAFGFDWLLVEAVGAGQSEIEIAAAVDVTVVALPPAGGDAVQALKAGVMEAGDVFVVTKCELPGADAAVATLKSVIELRAADGVDVLLPPVAPASAVTGAGIGELLQAVRTQHAALQARGLLERRRRDRLARRVRHLVLRELEPRLLAAVTELSATGDSPQALARAVSRRLRT